MQTVRFMMMFLCSTALLTSAACSQIDRPEQAQAAQQLSGDEFLHEHLPQQSFVTTAEAYRAMVMLAEGEDRFGSFAGCEEYLLAKKILRPEWKLDRDTAIDRGTVAYMVMRIVNIRGGINWNVFGKQGIGDRRYAVRELVFHKMMADGPPYRLISGPELVDLMTNADAEMSKRGAYQQEKVDEFHKPVP